MKMFLGIQISKFQVIQAKYFSFDNIIQHE